MVSVATVVALNSTRLEVRAYTTGDHAVNGNTLMLDFDGAWASDDKGTQKSASKIGEPAKMGMYNWAIEGQNLIEAGGDAPAAQFNPPNIITHEGATWTIDGWVQVPVDVMQDQNVNTWSTAGPSKHSDYEWSNDSPVHWGYFNKTTYKWTGVARYKIIKP
jgi:hypothetical protein